MAKGNERTKMASGWILITVFIGSYILVGIKHLHLIYAGNFIVLSLALSTAFVLLLWWIFRRG